MPETPPSSATASYTGSCYYILCNITIQTHTRHTHKKNYPSHCIVFEFALKLSFKSSKIMRFMFMFAATKEPSNADDDYDVMRE